MVRIMIREIFTLSSNLKELSLHYEFGIPSYMYCGQWENEWADFNYVPRNLNIVFADRPGCPNSFISSLRSYVPLLRNKKCQNFQAHLTLLGSTFVLTNHQ